VGRQAGAANRPRPRDGEGFHRTSVEGVAPRGVSRGEATEPGSHQHSAEANDRFEAIWAATLTDCFWPNSETLRARPSRGFYTQALQPLHPLCATEFAVTLRHHIAVALLANRRQTSPTKFPRAAMGYGKTRALSTRPEWFGDSVVTRDYDVVVLLSGVEPPTY
jgi:hypothetical protein